MAPKATPALPAAILVTSRRDSITHAIEIVPCEKKDDEAPRDTATPWSPDHVAGIWTDHGSLSWSVYRHNPGDLGSARPLSLDCVESRFRRACLVSLDDAERMVKAHKLVSKRLRALRDKMGYPQDFGEQVTRIAMAFGAEWIAVERSLYLEALQLRPTAFEGHRWIWVKIADARSILSQIRDVDVQEKREVLTA